MAFQNSECPIELLQQHHSRQLVRQRDAAKRNYGGSGGASRIRESVGGANRKSQSLRPASLVLLEKIGQLFGRKLPAALVEQNQQRGRAGRFLKLLEQRRFAGRLQGLHSRSEE